ncbi:hypothetical protein FocTR4_00004135 [Fusarium oxysporum f. sp. cubense]|uniref:Uncharacterized protein n=1 Tax=Fusarium oxysporum f. sp. cubense TaxID=61366 RepID=A0A5C6TBL4_FUSOC|nr:hypothetical protein FocTR4_00004135 [Fusarium oxysporum f. sp. cubense]
MLFPSELAFHVSTQRYTFVSGPRAHSALVEPRQFYDSSWATYRIFVLCALVSTAVSYVSRKPWTGIPVRENPRKFQRSVSTRRTSTERSSIAGTQRMGSLLERFIQHIKANRRLTKKAYDSKPKTIRLRKKASRAIASYSNRSAADSMKNHRAEHKRVIAINTLSCLIDISNTLRHIAYPAGATNSDVSSGSSTAAEMPVRCGPNKMPDECLWDLPSDEDEEK